jgi:leucyl aminopeptidase
MRFQTTSRTVADEALDAVVVPVFADGATTADTLEALGRAYPGPAELRRIAVALELTEAGSSCWLPQPDGPDLLAVSVGEAVGGAADAGRLRRAAMVAGRSVNRGRVGSLLALAAPDGAGRDGAVTATVESWLVGAYQFDAFRSESAPAVVEEVAVWGGSTRAVETGVVLGEVANRARDLINTPPSALPPEALVEYCRALTDTFDVTVNVLDRDALRDGGFGGLIGVGAGSPHPPALIQIDRGPRGAPHLALVGKGITFDSGGLSLKTTNEMQTMKADMAGVADVLAALEAAERLELPGHVRGYLACAENMPGPGAIRIGDVLRHRNGLTCEVVNTDCEGRLVLGDALAYAAEFAPAYLVDIATLTSSTGLGPDMWAVFGTDSALVAAALESGEQSGEPGWELPLWSPYAARLRSHVADIRNYDQSITVPFGAALAAQYLRMFVGDAPWAHIDLALTVMEPETATWPSGANGNGSRTLARLLQRFRRIDGRWVVAPDEESELVRSNDPSPQPSAL